MSTLKFQASSPQVPMSHYAEVAALETLVKFYERLCEEQRFQLMDLRLQRDEEFRDLKAQITELRNAVTILAAALQRT